MGYHIRVYCEDCEEYKRVEQETINEDWIPSGCETHSLNDFVIEFED